ncbi:MAG: CDP-diacylglycerol--glycerol-3-phosphate 3-phosphatidyltransferase [Gammaproteobacteria bacterium]|nr:CDP-diacylglycerol--glycerol-3-phosphate 3-phosphatidyltransferase [Gammaproteobacteria bacterium]PCH64449.1 MAG: CDP-diacylglycerol--glycerol-3-phosphate 3-phosphatidyltransferase [Gammaproteobacteria bacterium]
MTLPTQLTLLRIFLIPVFVIVFYLPYDWSLIASAGIFGVAAITDWLDGYLARKLNQASALGAFLDPVADKLMVAVALVLLTQKHPTLYFAIPAAIIICREIAVSALREWMAELGESASVAVSMVGKVKTTAQMIAIILLLYAKPIANIDSFYVGYVLFYVAAILTLWSMVLYINAAWPMLMRHKGVTPNKSSDDNDENRDNQ